jgi:cysteine synthase B
MIRDGERRGLLAPGKTIIDASSGNTGIAYAWIGGALGYPVHICLPENASPERKRILKRTARTLFSRRRSKARTARSGASRRSSRPSPDRYFYPDQYNNDANWREHYNGTALEIWDQTAGR